MPRRKEQEAIDEVLETLYSLDVQGYFLDEKILKSEANKRIRRTIQRLEEDKRKPVEDEAAYRLEQFERFSRLDEDERNEIVRLAKDRHISLEEAYRIASQ